MRKSIYAITIMALSLCSCGNSNKSTEEIRENQTESELRDALATQDSLFALINQITADMTEIRELENIISTPSGLNGEMPSRKDQIRNDIAAIRQALAERKATIEQLQKRISKLSGNNSQAMKTIEELKAQIATQETEIAALTARLADANIQIANLGATVDSLGNEVAHERKDKEEAQQTAENLDIELNTCYYAIGSKSELKAHNIISTGFLRKTKIMQGDYEVSYFTKADKRNLTSINLHSKKASVLTNQPKDSYTITDNADGIKILNITNPQKFWNLSNYLVVQVD